ncbi:MAG: hypothetical protein ACTSV2_08970 [Candidatus Thorarchaeota archaeon]
MSLREDSGQYCFLWMGVLFLSAYYFNIFYTGLNWNYSLSAMALVAGPLLLVFLFTGYIKPVRGKIKSTMFSIAVVVAALFTIIAFQYHDMNIDAGIFTAAWGVGSAILTAGGLSMFDPIDASTSPGILDVSKLHYGPPKVEDVEETKEVVEEEPTPPATEEPASETT